MTKSFYLKTIAGLLILCSAISCKEHRGAVSPYRSVLTIKPRLESCEASRQLSGRIKEAESINLAFKTAGQIQSIYVKEGQRVRKGQLLAVLDSSDYVLGIEAVEPQYRQLSAEVERLRTLLPSGGVSLNDFEKAETGLKQLGVQLRVNRNKVSYCRLESPCDGVISAVNFHESEMVDAGTPLFSLLDTRQMTVEVSLPAAIYRQKDRIVSYTGTAAGEEFPLKLLTMSPKADANQLYSARFIIDGGTGPAITSGINVNVSINLGDDGNARYSVPLHCIFEKNGGEAVWVVADGRVHSVPVTIEYIDKNGRAVLAEGSLKGGEDIVKAGVSALSEGQEVVAGSETSPTNIGNLL